MSRVHFSQNLLKLGRNSGCQIKIILNTCIRHTAFVAACVQSHGPVCEIHTGQTEKQCESDKNSLFLHSTPTARLDAIRIMRQRTFLFCCRGSSTFGDEYLSAVSSYPLRGGKQILAIYLIPPEIMSQQAQGGQSFKGAHRQRGKINK